MTSSGVYTFNPTIDDLITEAYERCGIEGSDISAQMWRSAMYSFNSVMVEATNKQLNLWEVEPKLLPISVGVRDYYLPEGTVDITECYRRSFTRVLSGTPTSSSGGTVANAFDSDKATSCTQTTPLGNISYDYGVGVSIVITMVGYLPRVTSTLTLVYEGSNDNSAWTTIAAPVSQVYTTGITAWEIVRTPASYRYYRVRAVSGTLDATEVYFANGEKDYLLGRFSRQEFDGIAVKTNSSIPVSYYIERNLTPMLHIFPTPDNQFSVLRYNRIRQIYSITDATETLDAPFRFIEAMTSMLAVKLALKKAPDKLGALTQLAQISIENAISEDRERVELTLMPDMGGYRL